MKKIIPFLLSLVFLINFACAQIPDQRPEVLNPSFDKKISRTISFTVPTISPKQLKAMDENIYILDAREEAEYNVSHIPNARCIGYDNFDISVMNDIPKDATVVLYCSIGYRSEKIGEKLQKEGFSTVYNLYGSIFEWMNQGFSVVNNEGAATQQVHTYNKAWSKWVDKNAAERIW